MKLFDLDCKTETVYLIPCTCNMVYIGQTGKCVNQRIQQHAEGCMRNEVRGQKGKENKEKGSQEQDNMKNFRLIEHVG